ncbi:2Fe-2S iron-sulfur cluster binding domain-containing protein [Variovorax gossypii]|uniref:2Fe-2S iron-sulfur cluster binding domain-containing protein n=1 Tax=Variovorax gossypii TaxID=1679495 RepID=A0A3S0JA26_9BURK|nr:MULTISPECIES: 2Fe-2S iron-sulfur cluster binding domain-containing protein [Variovorax]MDR6522138.1 3-phenylpropionate/trans-cinnamate dioxygenase ferredoxin reductase subunit/benzoate/toluate 1,2-dioxygenase reductase subunit [Variovorax paradoxus]RTQ35562.1 2Fe-2S iron-sulfur cluster binding domain-containing protein [Variovorax gossypii]
MSSIVPVTLLFSDGVAHRLDVPCGKKIVEAASEAGLNLLTDCSNGQCGTCTAQLLSGTVEMEDYDAAILPDDDRDAGMVLPCVCRVTSACAVEFPYESAEALSEEPAPIDGEVIGVRQVASETMLLEVSIPDGIQFEPGQYVRIHPEGSDFHRSYSMANVPGSSRLEFFIRLVPDGAFSNWLTGAKAGDKVELSVPHGTFFLRDEDRPRLFVAGGTGVAPFLSMLRSMGDKARAQPTTLLIGARTPGHLFALEELEALRLALPHVQVRLAVEQDANADCHQGYATDLITALGLAPTTRVYLCGPPPMVEAGRRAAEAAGLPRQDVLCERFA